MKTLKAALGARARGVGAIGVFSLRARAGSSVTASGPWRYCFCRSIGCGLGSHLCATGQDFSCYQSGETKQ